MNTKSFNSALQSASLWLLLQNTDNSKQYQPGMKVSPLAYQVSKINTERLKHLLVNNYPIFTTAGGRYPLPDDYFYTSSVMIPYKECVGDCETAEDWNLVPNYKEVRMMAEDKLKLNNGNALTRPNAKFPFGGWYDGYLQVYPTNVRVILLTYLKYPAVPVWVGTGPKDEYSSTLSTNLDWPRLCFNDLAWKTLVYYGVNIRADEVTALAAKMEATI